MNREEIKEELLIDINNNNLDLNNYEERLYEYADSAVPVYYYEIVKEWQEMPAEYNDRAQDDFGTEGGIYRLMSNDIYIYALDLYREVIEEIKSDIEEANSETPEKQYIAQCGHDDVLGYMSNTVCGKCARLNHKKAMG